MQWWRGWRPSVGAGAGRVRVGAGTADRRCKPEREPDLQTVAYKHHSASGMSPTTVRRELKLHLLRCGRRPVSTGCADRDLHDQRVAVLVRTVPKLIKDFALLSCRLELERAYRPHLTHPPSRQSLPQSVLRWRRSECGASSRKPTSHPNLVIEVLDASGAGNSGI